MKTRGKDMVSYKKLTYDNKAFGSLIHCQKEKEKTMGYTEPDYSRAALITTWAGSGLELSLFWVDMSEWNGGME
jgi:hypothetical protein